MTKISQLRHAFSQRQHRLSRKSRKFTLWLPGLALAASGLTLAQAGHSKATPAANSAASASVKVRATNVTRAKSISKPVNATHVTVKTGPTGSTSVNQSPSATSVIING